MSREELRQALLWAIGEVAPEADLSSVAPSVSLRDQLDLYSMDVLNITIALHDRLGVDIPEADYPKLSTLDRTVDYLAARGGVA